METTPCGVAPLPAAQAPAHPTHLLLGQLRCAVAPPASCQTGQQHCYQHQTSAPSSWAAPQRWPWPPPPPRCRRCAAGTGGRRGAGRGGPAARRRSKPRLGSARHCMPHPAAFPPQPALPRAACPAHLSSRMSGLPSASTPFCAASRAPNSSSTTSSPCGSRLVGGSFAGRWAGGGSAARLPGRAGTACVLRAGRQASACSRRRPGRPRPVASQRHPHEQGRAGCTARKRGSCGTAYGAGRGGAPARRWCRAGPGAGAW